jgi:hypothetical protein
MIAAATVSAFGLKPQVAHADGSSAGRQAHERTFETVPAIKEVVKITDMI